MSRTPLFTAVKKLLRHASHEHGIVWPRSSALTRRRLLRLSAAAAGAAALAPVINWRARAEEKGKPPSIAIIGGGAAGLTAAYRLQAADAKPVVFEASNRWGGRMFTQYDFYKGMFCELGGELVDSNHEDIHNLANELGVGMEKHTEGGARTSISSKAGSIRRRTCSIRKRSPAPLSRSRRRSPKTQASFSTRKRTGRSLRTSSIK